MRNEAGGATNCFHSSLTRGAQAISEEMKKIHAITMKCKTVKQWEEAGGSK